MMYGVCLTLCFLVISSTCFAQLTEWSMQLMTASFPMSARYNPTLVITYEPQQSNKRSINQSTSLRTNQTSDQSRDQSNNQSNNQPIPVLWLFGGAFQHAEETTELENDVWSSRDFGTSWSLRSGISLYGQSGRVDSPCLTCSFRAQQWSASYRSTLSNVSLLIGGHSSQGASNEIWTSSDNVNWSLASSPPFPPVYGAQATGNGDTFYLIGGSYIERGLTNDVWQGVINNHIDDQVEIQWTRIGRAPFSLRWWPLVITGQTAAGEIVYVMGGQNNDGTSAMNDVWIMQAATKRWAPLILDGNIAPSGIPFVNSFTSRSSHSGFINRDGAIIIYGGTSLESPHRTLVDAWVSWDGGFVWAQFIADMLSIVDYDNQTISYIDHHHSSINQTINQLMFYSSQGTIVSEQGDVVVMGGLYECSDMSCRLPSHNSRQIWKTDFSVHDSKKLALRCLSLFPMNGVGLKRWPEMLVSSTGKGTISSTASNHVEGSDSAAIRTTLIILAVFMCLFIVLAALFFWRRYEWSCRVYLLRSFDHEIAEINMSEANYSHM